MKVDTAIKHYGTATELARVLRLKSPGAVTNWRMRDKKGRVPELYARKLRDLTDGQLKFDPHIYGLDR